MPVRVRGLRLLRDGAAASFMLDERGPPRSKSSRPALGPG